MSKLLMSNQQENLLEIIMAGQDDKVQSSSTETKVPVKCDKIQKERAEKFVVTELAHSMGIYYLSDFITLCVREGVDKYSKPPEIPHRLFIPNTKDHLLDLDLDIYKNGIVCAKCDSSHCIHIEKIKGDRTVQKYIRKFLKSKYNY